MVVSLKFIVTNGRAFVNGQEDVSKKNTPYLAELNGEEKQKKSVGFCIKTAVFMSVVTMHKISVGN